MGGSLSAVFARLDISEGAPQWRNGQHAATGRADVKQGNVGGLRPERVLEPHALGETAVQAIAGNGRTKEIGHGCSSLLESDRDACLRDQMRVLTADAPVGGGVFIETAHRIAAEQRERMRLGELVPQRFQTDRRD